MMAAQKISYRVDTNKSIVRTLLYFDIFNYPITKEEIINFAPCVIDHSIDELLSELLMKKIIFRFGEYYSIQDNFSLAERRIKGNRLAEKKMSKARKYSQLIALFPFVRAVMLSGSISKGFMDEKSDIDYFIITETDRLWIVRTLLALFRRLFLFNSHKNFCTNYFIDQVNLEIREKNIFTAIEFRTLKPMIGHTVIDHFRSANEWVHVFLPNSENSISNSDEKTLQAKNVLEEWLSFFALTKFNRWLMNRTIRHWKRKYGNEMSDIDFEIAFRSTTGVSKSHPQFFQKKVLHLLEQKINQYEAQHGIELAV